MTGGNPSGAHDAAAIGFSVMERQSMDERSGSRGS